MEALDFYSIISNLTILSLEIEEEGRKMLSSTSPQSTPWSDPKLTTLEALAFYSIIANLILLTLKKGRLREKGP